MTDTVARIGTLDDALAAVKRVAKVAREYAQKAEDARGLPAEVVDAIDDAGLWAVFAPKCVGGCGLMGLTEQFEVIRAMAYEDASAGWGLFICGAGQGLIASRLPEAGRAEVFAEGPRPIAGVFNPAGATATRGDDGLRVTGSWSFASGIGYASWVLANALVLDATGAAVPGIGGLPEIRSALVPRDDVTIVDDWHVAGLRGTGSMSFTMQDMFVPEHRTFPFFGPAVIDELRYRVPLFTLVGPGLVGMAVGLAERALDEVSVVLHSKVGPPTFQPASGDPAKQNTLGKASTAVRGVRDAVCAAYARVDERVAAGEDLVGLPLAERAAMRSRSTWAVETCIAAVNETFRLGGATSIYEPGILQRCWRDANVLGQHLYLRSSNYEVAAKVTLGIGEDSPFI
jgi:alkylation response protein AidB-like acyl-CoA dehydrogenase